MKTPASIRLSTVLSASTGRLVVKGESWSFGTVTANRLNNEGDVVCSFYADYEDYEDGKKAAIRAAVFPSLPVGNYKVCKPGFTRIGRKVTVYPGHERELTLT